MATHTARTPKKAATKSGRKPQRTRRTPARDAKFRGLLAEGITQRGIKSLIPYVNNARTHSDDQITQIAASIKEFGWTNPVLVDGDNGIIAGHGRVLAAKLLGTDRVPCIELKGLSETQRKAYILADNRLAQNAGWDNDLLRIELTALDEMDFDISLLGFGDDELANLMNDPDEGLTDPDDVPEAPDPVTKPGDVWLLGKHRLVCGDSTSVDAVDVLMQGAKADMVFTDPPYGIDYSGGRTQVVKAKSYGRIKNDTLQGEELGGMVTQVFGHCKPGADAYICVSPIMQGPFIDAIAANGKEIDAVIVWDKKQPGLGYMAYRRQCEFILFTKGAPFKKGDASDFDLWQISRDNGKDYQHGTQKPVAVPQRAIGNSSKAGDVVLDLFGGSGSTLMACEVDNRDARLMEIDPHFCDVIVKRWEQYTGNTAVLEGSGAAFSPAIDDAA